MYSYPAHDIFHSRAVDTILYDVITVECSRWTIPDCVQLAIDMHMHLGAISRDVLVAEACV